MGVLVIVIVTALYVVELLLSIGLEEIEIMGVIVYHSIIKLLHL